VLIALIALIARANSTYIWDESYFVMLAILTVVCSIIGMIKSRK